MCPTPVAYIAAGAHKKWAGRSVKHPRKQWNSVCTAYYNEITINNTRQTTSQHVLYGMAKQPAAAKPGATKNKHLRQKKKRKQLVAEVHKEDQDILAKALEALWKL